MEFFHLLVEKIGFNKNQKHWYLAMSAIFLSPNTNSLSGLLTISILLLVLLYTTNEVEKKGKEDLNNFEKNLKLDKVIGF
jgi:hypothetical protein